METRMRRDVGVVIGGLGPIFLAGVLVGVRDHVQNANIALILVVVVVCAAAIGGRLAGACAAVVATLSFDFFHARPYLGLTIDSADDVETTLLLLAVGLLVGHVAAGAMRARASAEGHSQDIQRIHRMAELVARGEEPARVILAAQEELTELLNLKWCRFESQPFLPVLPRLERNGHVEMRLWRLLPGGFELPTEGVDLPVYGRGQHLGRFVLQPTPDVGVALEQLVVAVAIADQVGAVLAVPARLGSSGITPAPPGCETMEG